IKKDPESMSIQELEAAAEKLMKEMQKAAAELEFEKAAELRDKMMEIRRKLAEK
ncbi:MAG: UvrB/UvrC motif-containing protein, partial [Lachnospiraceae bacterium]|nr:UvrB/UvrC motif-containing protein [Lachnospiraceae bacterium]